MEVIGVVEVIDTVDIVVDRRCSGGSCSSNMRTQIRTQDYTPLHHHITLHYTDASVGIISYMA